MMQVAWNVWPQGVAVGKCVSDCRQMGHSSGSGWKLWFSSMSTSDVPLRGEGWRLSNCMGSENDWFDEGGG